MDKNSPFLLLMPSFNQAHFIGQAVASVLAQDDGNWELWIVDNSNDTTPEVLRQFADPRIHFHHIPARMDPGSCLNWMLERATGRDFSYVHTDNNLDPSFVRRMRAALAKHPLALAYCDMRTIDGDGKYVNVYRRGTFDLPRLLSTDTLGVPFAATVDLAKRVGGFSTQDFADDVRFCVCAYGLAEYVHVPEPLVDYRMHKDSRVEEAGGIEKMRILFVELMPKILPILEGRGLDPMRAIEEAIRLSLDDVDLYLEDIWHRKLSRWFTQWWRGPARMDHFFSLGLIDLPGFSRDLGRPPLRRAVRGQGNQLPLSIGATLPLRIYMRTRKRALRHLLKRPRSMLLTWAAMKLNVSAGTPQIIRLRSTDPRTLWAARQLEWALGWTPLVDPQARHVPSWIRWGTASGVEPLLDCSGDIVLTRSE